MSHQPLAGLPESFSKPWFIVQDDMCKGFNKPWFIVCAGIYASSKLQLGICIHSNIHLRPKVLLRASVIILW